MTELRLDLFERPWSRHYDREVTQPLLVPDVTLDQLLTATAAAHPAWVATSYADQDMTYGQLEERANRFANALRAIGVAKGDRVALLLPNSPLYPIAAYAVHKLGAVIVNIGVMIKGPGLAAITRLTGARVLATLDVFLPAIHGALPASGIEHLIVHPVAGTEKQLPPLAPTPRYFDELLRSHPSQAPERVGAPDDLALLQVTSGTTGAPKVVMHSHRAIVANLHQMKACVATPEQENPAVICLLPFFHVFGFLVCLQLSVLKGHRMVLVPRFDPLSVLPLLGLIEKYRPLSVPGVPGLWAVLVSAAAADPKARELLAGLAMPSCGGAPLSPVIQRRFEELTGRRLGVAYGLSEAPATHITPVTRPLRPGSMGIPLPGTDARIVDLGDRTRVLPPGEIGELAVRGPQAMLGYWQPAEGNATACVQDGWLYTGDLARCDADGYFSIVDRKDDLIITSGFNVYPSEVEAALRSHPAVADVAVAGRPDAVRGQVVEARVVLREGATAGEEELLEHCRRNLPEHKVPRRILLVAEIPKSPTGKPLRQQESP
jgi:long-chain acyl-CoA synthetase